MVHVAQELERAGFDLPLLIGGATTSAKHTAVKIAPCYGQATVHVADASRAVEVVSNLLQPEQRKLLEARLRAEQQAAREAFARREQAEIVPYEEAVRGRLALDWTAIPPPPSPEFLGRRALERFPLSELVPYIDWSPFFHVWELRGVFPRILDDPKYGAQARELHTHAERLLQQLVAGNELAASGVYGFWPAASEGDDLVLFTDDSRSKTLAKLHTLRQQTRHRDKPFLALADFVAPRDRNLPDYVGAFAVTAGLGLEPIVARYQADHDDYNAIMVKALADRLAEAFAEHLHERARRDWGYGREEQLSKEDLIRERYRGIRPAPGYPASPDHTEKRTLFDLLGVGEATGIELTESYAMTPPASVCGLYFSHPEARYFAVGRIGRDQVEDYARRKGQPREEIERWLRPYLDYES
jgi:5-methyltetrahydrofolate--homocysteine methyltransferase